MSIEVNLSTLDSISRRLHSSAMAVNKTGESAPGSVDAGVMTSLVSAMMSGLTESAAGLSEGIELASTEVLNTKSTYWSADEAARDSLTTTGGQP